MAHIWVPYSQDEARWAVFELAGPRSDLLPNNSAEPDHDQPSGLALLPAADGWAVVSAPRAGVLVNGLPVDLGIRVLSDRDEIRQQNRGRVFFSTERLLAVEPFPGADREILCPRCRTPIEKDTPSVRCQCAAWYHQSSDFPCFTYAAACMMCGHSTSLDADYDWSPEDLGA